jgi:Flp pilus assembly pilin Flp
VHDATGQATTEYAGLLALIAAALLGAGMLVGLEGVAAAVEKGIRTGICIVGGDVCRSSDAAAAGLEPCTVADRSGGGGTTISVAWVRLGDSGGWTVATRSDGSVLVTRTHERKGGVGAGIGLEASPLGLHFGVEGKLDLDVMSGATWEFPDGDAAARFLEHGDDGQTKPTWRFGEAGEVLTGEAGAEVAGATLTGVAASAQAAGGARVGRGRTTLYIRSKLESGASVWLPKHSAQLAGPGTGDVIVELTLEHGAFREIGFRTAGVAGEHGRVVDTVARLDLRDPENRAAAAHLLTHRLPWPANVARELHELMLYTVQRGTVERAVYDVRDESGTFELAARLGEELGIEVNHVKVQRRLVAASAWTPGSQERLREDCVM